MSEQSEKKRFTKKNARERMMDYLARRDHSEKELRQKLRKYHEKEEIEAAIEFAKNKNWFPKPEKVSEVRARMLHRRLKGYLFIVNDLKQKGLPMISKDEELELEKAREVLEKFERPNKPLDKPKMIRLLKNRGFDLSSIRKVTNEKR